MTLDGISLHLQINLVTGMYESPAREQVYVSTAVCFTRKVFFLQIACFQSNLTI